MTPASVSAPTVPAWLREVDVALAANPQVVITGNLRDLVLLPSDGPTAPPRVPVSGPTAALVRSLRSAGHRNIASFNPCEGLSTLADENGVATRHVTSARETAGAQAGLIEELRCLLRAIAWSETPCCLIIEGASRVTDDDVRVGSDGHSLLVTAEHLLLTAPRRPVAGTHRTPLYNTIFWLLDRENDLPHWLVSSPLMRVVSIPMPSLSDRKNLITPLVNSLPGAPPSCPDNPQTAALIDRYASLTAGFDLRSITEVNRLAIDRGIAADHIADAIRTFRVGIPENPWHDPSLKTRIGEAVPVLSRTVLGQPAAIRKAVDILIRSTMRLTGAQAIDAASRPQGVLFFAGPTGVGKTELAKAMAELIFGRRDAFLRFDMSEFSAEHAQARLIGAPPGYIGHDAGGELTNAIRQQPFRLVLFDEVEKAHPRILDKFLQILEDGRLTDGNGSTVYFSETLIVFTSNLGVYRNGHDGRRIPCVRRGADYRTVETAIRAAVAQHFTEEIGRPELLNRIGDNIVVFDFISEDVADRLVDLFLGNLARRIRETTGATLSIGPAALGAVRATARENLDFGGRGVANMVESMLVNPLARALFELAEEPRHIDVAAIVLSEEGWTATLGSDAPARLPIPSTVDPI